MMAWCSGSNIQTIWFKAQRNFFDRYDMGYQGDGQRIKGRYVHTHSVKNAYPADAAHLAHDNVCKHASLRVCHLIYGTLKDASEIEWTFDADESIPFPSEAQNALGACDGRGVAPTPLALSAEGTRWSTCVFCPSRQLLEASEVFSTGLTVTRGTHPGTKCRAPPGSVACRVACKIVIDVDEYLSSEMPDEDDTSTEAAQDPGNDDATMEPVLDADDLASETNYQSIKAMADADHKVCHLLYSICIFTC